MLAENMEVELFLLMRQWLCRHAGRLRVSESAAELLGFFCFLLSVNYGFCLFLQLQTYFFR